MALPQSKVTSQGQVSVPAEIRRKLGIGPGTVLEWEQDGDKVVVRKTGNYSSHEIHKALFGTAPRMRTLDELKQSISRHAKAKNARR